MSDIIKKFAASAKRVIAASLAAARELGHTYVGSEHLLMGLASDEGSTPTQLLIDRGCVYSDIRERVVGMVGMGCKSSLTAEDMTPVYRRIILRASFIARADGSVKVGSEHLLMAMLCEECVGTRLLEDIGVDIVELSGVLESLYGEQIYDDCDDSACEECGEREECEYRATDSDKTAVPTPLLDANAVNMSERARDGQLDPVIGREQEEARLISILLRRTKNNPCLIGEAGVGKTAVVESLAARIVEGRVPPELRNKRIMSLELASVVAGTKYRGEFEEKIKSILDEVRAAKDVILFIDEIHTIVGAGGAEGAIDASNILKPALARGEIRLIGATTLREYKQSIEKDKALERRFQTVTVREPDKASCRRMLLGLRAEYESYHGVRITDSAIDAAIDLSSRYITERFLPDKAIDLLDEAAAARRTLAQRAELPSVDGSDVASAVELRTGIPVSVLTAEESDRLLSLENELKSRIIGQDEAVSALASAVRRARSGVRSDSRPGGSFLFVGSAGVGKTECARALAEAVFGGSGAMLRLDMSEYSEPHSVSKLIGAPAGYVGYGEGGLLTERLRRDPYTLVLFDELEKAHPDVRALMLQILDEGILTDSAGLRVSFAESVVIMTSNLPSGQGGIGFGAGDRADGREAVSFLPPELVDRFDEVIRFRNLDAEDLCRIVGLKLEPLCEELGRKGINVTIDGDFVESIVKASRSRSARGASRFALRTAEDVLSRELLCGRLSSGDEAALYFDNGRASLKIKQRV